MRFLGNLVILDTLIKCYNTLVFLVFQEVQDTQESHAIQDNQISERIRKIINRIWFIIGFI